MQLVKFTIHVGYLYFLLLIVLIRKSTLKKDEILKRFIIMINNYHCSFNLFPFQEMRVRGPLCPAISAIKG